MKAEGWGDGEDLVAHEGAPLAQRTETGRAGPDAAQPRERAVRQTGPARVRPTGHATASGGRGARRSSTFPGPIVQPSGDFVASGPARPVSVRSSCSPPLQP